MNTQTLRLLVAALLATSAATAQSLPPDQTLITQDFATGFADFTTQNSNDGIVYTTTSDGFAYSSSPGVGGTAGRIDAIAGTGNHSDSVRYSGTDSAITWTPGLTYKTSVSFLQGPVVDNHLYQVTSGFLREAGANFAGLHGGIWGQMRDNGAGNPILRLIKSADQVGTDSVSFALSANNWYELETRMTLASATTADIGVYLYSRGADGTSPRTLIQSVGALAVTISNDGFKEATFYTGFGGGNNTGANIVAFDGFSVTASSATPPSAPTNFGANTGSNSSIVLWWADTSSNETGFIVERSTNSDSGFTPIATALPEATTYTDTGLTANTTYYYRISATNAHGQSTTSPVASASTATPDTLIFDPFVSSFAGFTTQNNGSSDGFSHSTSNGVAATAGRINAIGASNHTDSVYYSGTNSVTTWTAGITYKTSLFFLQGTVTDGQIYQVTNGFLRSTGSNFSGGGSGIWGQLRDNSGAGNPFLRLFNQGTQVGANSATFTLSADTWYELETTMTLTSASSGALAVKLYARGPDGTSVRTLVQSISAPAVTIGNGGFNSGSFITTFGGGNHVGSNILALDNFSLRAGSADPDISAAPTGLAATATSGTTIGLTWTDASSDETGFVIERSTTSGSGFSSVATPAANDTSYTDTSLSPGTTYYYRVRSANASGQSSASNEASATTTLTTPAAPTGLVATTASSTSIGLTWTDASTNETGFVIERSTTSGSGFTSIATLAADATSYTDTGLSPGTTYYYRVSSANTSGQSTASAEATATTRTAYAQWKLDTGLGADALDTADADFDGLANLVEYALGTSPTNSTASPIVTSVSGGFLTLTVTKAAPTPADVTLDAEATGDLVAGPWADAVILIDDATTFQARDTVSTGSASRRFLRLAATR